jgi:hypothetical protein
MDAEEDLVNRILEHGYDSDENTIFEAELLTESTGKTKREWKFRADFYDFDGTVNEEFLIYCKENGLSKKLKKRKI